MKRAPLALFVFVLLPCLAAAADIRIPIWGGDAESVSAIKLVQGELRASIDDVETSVAGLLGPGEPIILLVVFDTVGDLNRVDLARETLAQHFENMGEEWYVALLQAQDGLRVLLDPSQQRGKLVETLNALPTTGYPGLLDAVAEAAEIADSMLQNAGVRVAVLFVTDGGIDDYRGDYTAAVVNPSDRGDLSRRFRDRVIQEKIGAIRNRLQTLAAPLFFVHLEERSDTLNTAYQNGLRQFAEETAGETYFVRSVSETSALTRQALDRIDRHYSVSLTRPARAEGAVRVQIEAENSVRLDYRQSIELVEIKKRSD